MLLARLDPELDALQAFARKQLARTLRLLKLKHVVSLDGNGMSNAFAIS